MNITIKPWLKVAAAAAVTAGVLGLGSTSAMAANKTVKVATDASFVPFESIDPKTHESVGYDIDMIKAIGKRAGFDVKFKLMDFNGVIPALQSHSVDMAIAGITITKERAKAVDFSDPYYDSGLKLAVMKDNDSIKTIDDLKGKKVSTKIGSTSYDFLKKNVPDIGKIKPYPGTAEMYMALTTGNVDAAFYDVPNVLYFIKTKAPDKVKAVGPLYEGQQYGIAFPKGSDLRAQVNKALADMKEDGTFAKIYKKWFDAEPPKDLLETDS